ncbi:hypothetical protein SUGI_0322750, partial [Cryptomeria japonica]
MALPFFWRAVSQKLLVGVESGCLGLFSSNGLGGGKMIMFSLRNLWNTISNGAPKGLRGYIDILPVRLGHALSGPLLALLPPCVRWDILLLLMGVEVVVTV